MTGSEALIYLLMFFSAECSASKLQQKLDLPKEAKFEFNRSQW
jgi:hypothetical protein